MISRPNYFADLPDEFSRPYKDDMGRMTDLTESFTRAGSDENGRLITASPGPNQGSIFTVVLPHQGVLA